MHVEIIYLKQVLLVTLSITVIKIIKKLRFRQCSYLTHILYNICILYAFNTNFF